MARPLNILPINPPPFFFLCFALDNFSTKSTAIPCAFSRKSTVSFIFFFIPIRPLANPCKEDSPPSNILPKNLLGSNESTLSSTLFDNFGIKFCTLDSTSLLIFLIPPPLRSSLIGLIFGNTDFNPSLPFTPLKFFLVALILLAALDTNLDFLVTLDTPLAKFIVDEADPPNLAIACLSLSCSLF